MKVLITGMFSSLNKGDEARVRSSVEMIRAIVPEARFDFLTAHPTRDANIYKTTGIDVVPRYRNAHSSLGKSIELLLMLVGAVLWRTSGGRISVLRSRQFCQYKVFMDLSGETLSDYFRLGDFLVCLHPILLGILLKCRTVLFAQSIGPFDGVFSKSIARFVLNRVTLITLRDNGSIVYLERCGIHRPHIFHTSDPAFTFQPVPHARSIEITKALGIHIHPDRPLIGICASRGGFRRGLSGNVRLAEKYQALAKSVAQVVDRLIDQLNATVIFVPHVIAPGEDDRTVFEDIRQHTRHTTAFKLIPGECTSQEMKAVIGLCDLFIGSRLHANIAALSSLVPVVAIAYSHKMPGIMESLGLAEYVCDVETIAPEILMDRVMEVWIKRDTIRQQLEPRLREIHEQSLDNARLLKQWCT